MADFYATMKDKLQAKPKPTGPVLENYVPSWGDWLANKAADMFGSSNAGRQSITDYMRDKINPALPLVGAQQAVRDIQGKAKGGNLREAVMDTALETAPGGGAAKAIFIGPAARSWNKAAAKEATSMLRAKKPLSDIWKETKTGFHKVGESPRGPQYPGKLSPMQEVNSRKILMSPDLMAGRINPRAAARPLEESVEHPIFSEYPGTGDIPLWAETNPSVGGSLLFTSRRGQKVPGLPGIPGITVKPGKRPSVWNRESEVADVTGENPPTQQTLEHEFQHLIQHLEGWPMSTLGGGEAMGAVHLGHVTPDLPEFKLAKDLLGRYGEEKYPNFSDRGQRLKFGLYAHDTAETMARNAEARTFLDQMAREATPPDVTMDIPFHSQMLSDEVWNRHWANQLKGLMNP